MPPATTSTPARRRRPPLGARGIARVLAAVAVLGFAVTAVFATPLAMIASQADKPTGTDAGTTPNGQQITIPDAAELNAIDRDSYGATDGVDSLVAGGTNRDWAELVLLSGGFPRSESNITVMLRWMRQENGPDDWWNRNNPLNNGWGSGGGSGLGSYDSLVTAAEYAGIALHGNPGYADIVAGLQSSADTAVIESAIWASPWATSHYGNGTHWSQSEVPLVSAPADAWQAG